MIEATDEDTMPCKSRALACCLHFLLVWRRTVRRCCIICLLTLVQNGWIVSENHLKAAEIGHAQHSSMGVAGLEQGGERHAKVRFAPATPAVSWSSRRRQ